MKRRSFLKHAALGGAAGTVAASPLAALARAEEPAGAAPAPVERRPFGKSNIPVSIVGLGLGSAFTKPHGQDQETAEKLLEQALSFGINFWDTCRGYGPSEKMIGPMVAKHRKDIFLVTKSGGRDYDRFMRDFENSLKLLKTDYIDLMHIWNIKRDEDLDRIENGALKAVRKLKEDKVIGQYGITGHSGAAILAESIKRFDPDAMLTVYPCTRDDQGRYEDVLLPMARERKMGVVAMKTVRRARNADLKGSDLIRYALSLDGVHCTIVGLDTEAHLTENVKMAQNFQPMAALERDALHRDAVRALADIPTPWEQPGYQDGQPA